ncbi:NADH-quinone oxidoreductase subunit J [Nitrososphaera sp.]|uniref:NADH-quinone oxidoreductase subunit J family protein n=1 Tax=Nitrososphaera sp. TaxID=1971748 RepID=UPI0017AE7767|nr:NADH-quinone oxidoreductase subunit J [Nitrososphaera sp.]NWG38045.1 NADH-quinone oxidoreductase subunit J [Nitrososphaera sp.]
MVDPIFVGLAVLTVGSAIVALDTKELIYGAIGLAISMLGIAGFFLLLDAPFVAMFQIAVYVGAVAVLIIFAVMLVRTQALFTVREDKGRKAAGIILMLFIMGGLGATLLISGLNTPGSFTAPPVDIMAIGQEMLTYYSPTLIVMGLVLAGAVIAALALARREDVEQKDERAS